MIVQNHGVSLDAACVHMIPPDGLVALEHVVVIIRPRPAGAMFRGAL